MKKAFTLIEIIIVLVIIGVLLGVTMQFSATRIVGLKAQANKDRFVDAYTNILTQNMISSYQGSMYYQTLRVSVDTGMQYSYDSGQQYSLLSDPGNMTIKALQLSGQTISDLSFSLTPYHLGCSGFSGKASFQLLVNTTTYCFFLSPDTCSLHETACQ